jgi:hypothetical protein
VRTGKDQCPTKYRHNIRVNVVGQQDYERSTELFNWAPVQVKPVNPDWFTRFKTGARSTKVVAS